MSSFWCSLQLPDRKPILHQKEFFFLFNAKAFFAPPTQSVVGCQLKRWLTNFRQPPFFSYLNSSFYFYACYYVIPNYYAKLVYFALVKAFFIVDFIVFAVKLNHFFFCIAEL